MDVLRHPRKRCSREVANLQRELAKRRREHDGAQTTVNEISRDGLDYCVGNVISSELASAALGGLQKKTPMSIT